MGCQKFFNWLIWKCLGSNAFKAEKRFNRFRIRERFLLLLLSLPSHSTLQNEYSIRLLTSTACKSQNPLICLFSIGVTAAAADGTMFYCENGHQNRMRIDSFSAMPTFFQPTTFTNTKCTEYQRILLPASVFESGYFHVNVSETILHRSHTNFDYILFDRLLSSMEWNCVWQCMVLCIFVCVYKIQLERERERRNHFEYKKKSISAIMRQHIILIPAYNNSKTTILFYVLCKLNTV